MPTTLKRIRLADEALRRGIPYRKAYDMLLRGEIPGVRGPNREWLVLVGGRRAAASKSEEAA